jgi:hypothetical protein
MSITGCPLTIYWSDTRTFELTNISDGQLTGGMSSDRVYAYLYESGMLSRKPSRLYITYVDSQGTGAHNIALVPPDATLQEFEDFLVDVNFTDAALAPGKPTPFLMLVDAPFDYKMIMVSAALAVYALFFKEWWPVLVVIIFMNISLRDHEKRETIQSASYRYKMAKLAKLSVDSLKMYNAL